MMFLRKNAEASPIRKPFKNKAALLILLSFLLPLLVTTLAMIAMRVVPFGDTHNLAITDAKWYLNGQMFFSRLLKGEENFLYSFNSGLGANEWSQLAWGGFSFGNLLSLFASLETIPSLFTWICGVNIALCGLTMYLLLACLKGHKLSHLIFSTSYALIGFNVVNCYQTLFFMGPQLLPLVVLGLVRLLRGKSPLLYILSLAFCIFFNFYFGFHLCVISAILFLAYFYARGEQLKGNRLRLFRNWFVSSVIAGLLAAPMWLPALKAYTGGGRLDQTTLSEFTFSENMPFIQIFSKLFSGANSTDELVNGLPNIFCGILVVALVILYFLNKGIDGRRKRAAAAVLAFYLLTFYVTAFTLIMHGGTHTNWFPYRYSYVFSFLLICLAAEEFQFLDDITVRDGKICGISLLAAAILVFSTKYEFISAGTVLLDFALLLFMWLGFRFYKTRPDKAPLRTLSMLLIILTGINLYANFIVSTKNVQDWELDLKEYNDNIMISGALTEALNIAEPGFFRMEKDKSESNSVAADPLLYNYNGVSHSGPAERMFVHRQLSRLGINWYDMRHWYSEGIPAATDTLLGLNYIISERDLNAEKQYEKLITMGDAGIFRNNSALSPAILSNGTVQELELGSNVFENLNTVWKAMTGGNADVFTLQEDVTFTLFNDYSNQSVTGKELREQASSGSASADEEQTESSSYILYTFEATRDGPIYVFDTSIPDSANGLAVPAIKHVGNYGKGDTVEGKFPIHSGIGSGDLLRGYCVNMVFAYADNTQLETYAALLNSRETTFDPTHENDVTGAFTAGEGQRLLFTFPWDEGWTCYIDGQKVPIDKTWDLFMSVEVPAGTHTYEMKFIPAWMDYGLILCAVAFAGLILVLILWKKNQKAADPDALELSGAERPQTDETVSADKSADGSADASSEETEEAE